MALLPTKEVHLLCGASGSGKTHLLLQGISAWARGDTFVLGLPSASKCVYITTDRASTGELASEIVGTTDKFEFVSLADKASFLSLKGRSELARLKYLEQFIDYNQIVILDPIGPFLTSNLISYSAVMWSMLETYQWCRQREITIIGVHHAAKKTQDFGRPQDRISGSAALQGFSGSQAVLIQGNEGGKDNPDECHIIHHHAAAEKFYLRKTDKGVFELTQAGETPLPTTPTETVSKTRLMCGVIISICKAAPNEEFDKSYILVNAATQGISSVTVYRYMKILLDEGTLQKTRHGYYKIA